MYSSDKDIQLGSFMEELLSFDDVIPSSNKNIIDVSIADWHYYIDTVVVYFDSQLPLQLQEYIQPDPKKRVYNSHPMKYRKPGYLVKLSLHQPTKDVIERLIEINAGDLDGIHLTELAIAVDTIFKTEEGARTIEDFENHYIVKKNHGKQKVKTVNRTRYIAGKYAAVNLVTYSDKPSRFTGEPCLHTEFRFRHKKTLERIGIRSVFDLLALSDPNNIRSLFDKLFERHLAYFKLDRRTWIRIGQVISGETKRSPNRIKRYKYKDRVICQYNWYERIGRLFIRGRLGTEEQFTIQELKDLMQNYDKRFNKYLNTNI